MFGFAPLEVTFTCSARDFDGFIVSYDWDFGDGQKEKTDEDSTTHTFSAPAAYTATLTVTDDSGVTDKESKRVVVVSLCPVSQDLHTKNLEPYYDLKKHLAGTKNGAQYVSLYYRHSPEISKILLMHPSLFHLTRGFLQRIIPSVTGYVQGTGTAVNKDITEEASALLGEISQYASPQLKVTLKKLREDLKTGRLFELRK